MYTFDHELFLWLNFDGGKFFDTFMLGASTPMAWSWLYLLIFYMVWRTNGWRGVGIFILTVVIAVGGADMVAGIFKHSGLLKNLLPDFPVRLRPMHTPELQGLMHVIKEGGRYGTVSAHAATTVALAVITSIYVKRRWMTWLMVISTIIICYSRIYLAYHFPMDIMLGVVTGLLTTAVSLAVCLPIKRKLCKQQ